MFFKKNIGTDTQDLVNDKKEKLDEEEIDDLQRELNDRLTKLRDVGINTASVATDTQDFVNDEKEKLEQQPKGLKKKKMVGFSTDIQDDLVDIEKLKCQISDLYNDLVQTRTFLNKFCNKLKEISKKKEMVDFSRNIQDDLVYIERLEHQISELDNKLKFGEKEYNKLLEEYNKLLKSKEMVDFSTDIQDDLVNIKELENQRNNHDATLCQYQEQLKKLHDKLKKSKKERNG